MTSIRAFASRRGRRALALLERALLAFDWRAESPQLFILGLPRSGTTLVSQYAVHRLRVAYFTNGVGAHPEAPLLTTLVQSRLLGHYRSDFRSAHGRVRGAVAPREAGSVWGRTFGFERYVRFDDLAPGDVRALRRLVAAVQRAFGDAPFVNKNVKHVLRIDALARIFPAARFLVVRRELPEVALSILRARLELLDDPTRWWSVMPPDYEALRRLPLPDQVAGQVFSLRDRLHRDLAELAAERVLWLDYERFCREPESLVALLRGAFGELAPRGEPVARFLPSSKTPSSDEERRLWELVGGDAR